MSERYNPHSMQKQARKWPVSLSIEALPKDINARFEQSRSGDFTQAINPMPVPAGVSPEIADEYGVDCCRLAVIVAQGQQVELKFFDSTFKWLSRLYADLHSRPTGAFVPALWLEMFLQGKDMACSRNNIHAALARLRLATKLSRLNSDLPDLFINLAAICLYPFAPVFSLSLLAELPQKKNMQTIIAELDDLQPIRFCLENGGWHWGVFQRRAFAINPLQSLLQRKWVSKACQGQKTKLKETDEGLIICLN